MTRHRLRLLLGFILAMTAFFAISFVVKHLIEDVLIPAVFDVPSSMVRERGE